MKAPMFIQFFDGSRILEDRAWAYFAIAKVEIQRFLSLKRMQGHP